MRLLFVLVCLISLSGCVYVVPYYVPEDCVYVEEIHYNTPRPLYTYRRSGYIRPAYVYPYHKPTAPHYRTAPRR